jgi:hypothetical protein
MNKLKNIAAEWWPDGLMTVGAAAVSFGVWQMHAPSMLDCRRCCS